MDSRFIHKLYQNHQDCATCIKSEEVIEWFDELIGALFPEYQNTIFTSTDELEAHFIDFQNTLEDILNRNSESTKGSSDTLVDEIFAALPGIHKLLEQDIEAIYAGDPAAKSRLEVIRTYPGFFATVAHRIAHKMHQLEIPTIPRIISEYAHTETGIDIHPGAQIGHHFCIDHGTGIVIGETTIIGNHVKIYQGVTLGALSVEKEAVEKQRHPTIGDHVVIYAGATILGGLSKIGDHSIIGGNVWLTHGVPANSKVLYKTKEVNQDGEDVIVIK